MPLGRITGITGAAMEVTERKRLEEEILQISEMEQRRIGQDLHDGICQHLAGIELKSQSLAETLEKKARGPAAQAEQIARHVRDVIAQTRSLARGLSPFILEAEGCVSALRELAAQHGKTVQRQMSISRPAGRFRFPIRPWPPTSIASRRKRSPTPSNTAKPAPSKSAWPTRTTKFSWRSATTASAFNAPVQAGTGMGLRIMQYRAGMIGATLLVQAQAKGGTRIVCFLQNTGSRPAK